jgi:hypothetical protein
MLRQILARLRNLHDGNRCQLSEVVSTAFAKVRTSAATQLRHWPPNCFDAGIALECDSLGPPGVSAEREAP